MINDTGPMVTTKHQKLHSEMGDKDIKANASGLRDGSEVKNTHCGHRGPNGSLQRPVPPAPGDLVLFSNFSRFLHARGAHTYTHYTQAHTHIQSF